MAKKSISDSDIALVGYNVFRIDRAGRGGGVAIYVKSSLSISVLSSVSKPKCFVFSQDIGFSLYCLIIYCLKKTINTFSLIKW